MAALRPSSRVMTSHDLNVVGSTAFGRDPKINSELTLNLVIADDFLVNYAGWKNVKEVIGAKEGRGDYTSTRLNKMIVVLDNKVYTVSAYQSNSDNLFLSFVGNIDSFSGDVFISENNADQIAICDQHNLYIYDYAKDFFKQAKLPDGFICSYVTFQNGYFIITNSSGSTFALSAPNDGLNWFWGDSGQPVLGSLSTKADFARAAIRMPGHGNLLIVFGNNVAELWTDSPGFSSGSSTFPYQRASTVNIDYGLINQATLAGLDSYIAWVGVNEISQPVIMYSSGSEAKQFPDVDGINYRLSLLKNPSKCLGFFVKLAGKLFYQVTWYDPQDNITFIFDFSLGKFYSASSENMNFHIARRVAYFNNKCYFVSITDGNIYEMSPDLFSYDYGNAVYEIPRVRICKTLRLPGPSRYACPLIEFLMEQGCDPSNHDKQEYRPRVDMTLSRDGGRTFGNSRFYYLNPVGKRMNRINWFSNGAQNELTVQFRFWGFDKVIASNGYVGVYQ